MCGLGMWNAFTSALSAVHTLSVACTLQRLIRVKLHSALNYFCTNYVLNG